MKCLTTGAIVRQVRSGRESWDPTIPELALRGRKTEAMSENSVPRNDGLDRRTFLRATVLGVAGVTAPALLGLGDVASAARRRRATTTTTPPGPAGPRLRVGAPGFSALEAHSVGFDSDTMMSLSGLVTEHLVGLDSSFRLLPQLATDWRSNDVGTIWSFTVRSGVVFHNGAPVTAEAIAASLRTTLAAGQGGQLTGIVAPDAVRALRPNIVRFTLAVPFGLFPYLVSSDNPASAIVNKRAGSKAGEWLGGTGPFVALKPEAGTGTANALPLRRNAKYWRTLRTPLPYQSAQLVGYANDDDAAGLFAAKTVDLVTKVNNRALAKYGDPNLLAINMAKSTAHYQVHMRTDGGVFADRRVRQALQLAVDRVELAKVLYGGRSDVANDTAFASFLPFVGQVAARPQNISAAKQLMRDARQRSGFTTKIALGNSPDALALAGSLASFAAKIGIVLEPAPSDTYFADSWLNSDVGITEFSHRATPGALVAATLGSDGQWNAPHYRDPKLDALIRTLSVSRDTRVIQSTTQAVAEQLRSSVPILVPFFMRRTWLARKQGFTPLQVSPHGQMTFV